MPGRVIVTVSMVILKSPSRNVSSNNLCLTSFSMKYNSRLLFFFILIHAIISANLPNLEYMNLQQLDTTQVAHTQSFCELYLLKLVFTHLNHRPKASIEKLRLRARAVM